MRKLCTKYGFTNVYSIDVCYDEGKSLLKITSSEVFGSSEFSLFFITFLVAK